MTHLSDRMKLKVQLSRIGYTFAVAAILCVTVLSGCVSGRAQWQIHNPYAGVDWEHFQQHKASLHIHTTMSDGSAKPEEVIDLYAELGYSILALTDHDTVGPGTDGTHPERHKTTWPWHAFDRAPDMLDMVAVEGNEVSRLHHIGSYFNDYGDADVISEELALAEIGRRGGLAVLFHPGRYQKSTEWYAGMYRSHPHLVGLEIFNQGDRYPGDEEKWDEILTEVIADRGVWGFSNDDMHVPAMHLGRNWNVMLLPELSEYFVRKAMEDGTFFYVYAAAGHDGAAPPTITSIAVDSRRGAIYLKAENYERIEWISKGAIVHQGALLELSRHTLIGGYVRAVIYGAGGESLIGTQPFRVQLQAR